MQNDKKEFDLHGHIISDLRNGLNNKYKIEDPNGVQERIVKAFDKFASASSDPGKYEWISSSNDSKLLSCIRSLVAVNYKCPSMVDFIVTYVEKNGLNKTFPHLIRQINDIVKCDGIDQYSSVAITLLEYMLKNESTLTNHDLPYKDFFAEIKSLNVQQKPTILNTICTHVRDHGLDIKYIKRFKSSDNSIWAYAKSLSNFLDSITSSSIVTADNNSANKNNVSTNFKF